MHDDDFTIRAKGHLLDQGLWQIDAELHFRDGVRPEPGDLLLGMGRLALHQAILSEAARGRVQGATSVRVRLSDLGQAFEFDLSDPGKDRSPWH